MPAPLEFWFDFASTYSYVAAMRLEPEAARAGVEVTWHPFLLGPIFHEQLGIQDSPFNVQPVRGRYMWRDLERLCAKYGIPYRKPSVFPRNSVLASRVACLRHESAFVSAFSRAVFQANFARDEDISDPKVLARIIDELGGDGGDLLDEATSPENKGLLRAATDTARAHHFFGAPNFVVAGEHFFGQDRLNDALEWAAHG